MIRIGLRRNLRYPLLFILFTLLRRGIKFIMERFCLEKRNVSFLMVLFMIFFELILGIIYSCKDIDLKKEEKAESTITEVKIIQYKKELKRPDGLCKIVILNFFSGYFEIIGFLSRRFITILDPNKKEYDEFNARYRSIEICASSLLCFFTLKMKILRHHYFSLIIIILSLFIVFVIELVQTNYSKEFLIDILIIYCTSISRAFLDTTEKYLFDIDFVPIFTLIRFQSSINLILMSLLYFFPKPQKEIKDLIDFAKEPSWKPIFAIFLLMIYALLTGYKNIYRRYTVKEYSPMSRSLAESVIDPFLIIFGFITDENNENNISIPYILGITILSVIMVFSSCVYNEVFVLYFCGLEHETHLEITKRARFVELEQRETILEKEDEDGDNK